MVHFTMSILVMREEPTAKYPSHVPTGFSPPSRETPTVVLFAV